MLSLIAEACALIKAQTGSAIDFERIRLDDPAVFAMIAEADTIGVFQVESRSSTGLAPAKAAYLQRSDRLDLADPSRTSVR